MTERILHTVKVQGVRLLHECIIRDPGETMKHTGLHKRLPAEGVRHNILRTGDVSYFKVERGELSHPSLFTSIESGLTQNVGQRIIVRPCRKLVASQPVAEFVTDSPFERQKLQPMCWVARLGIVERFAGECNRTCYIIPLSQLR